jgi:hypothetical protein
MAKAIEQAPRRAALSAFTLWLLGACATEIQEPSDAQGLASSAGGNGGSAGESAGVSGQPTSGGGSEPHGGAAVSGGNAGSAGGSTGGAGNASGGSANAGAGSGGGGAGGSAGMSGAAGKGGGGGMSGSSGAGGGAMGGSAGKGGGGGSGGMPNNCEKQQLKITGATASSTENDTFPASKAFDGDVGTRWASAQTEPQWIYLDLGEVAHVSRVVITWETAFATNYRIEIAQAAAGPWTSMFQESAGNGAVDDLTNLTARNGRYVRMYGNTRSTPYGFSIWELAIYGDLDETCK